MPMNRVISRKLACPNCGERIEILIDASVDRQDYVEDCEVCCRPISVNFQLLPDGEPLIQLSDDDDDSL